MANWVEYKEWVALKAFYRRIDEQILPSWAINILYSYMEENKYYIPTLGEFHVGFECEQYNDMNKQWELYTISKNTWSSNGMWKMLFEKTEQDPPHFNSNSFRVKYLDKEDIESLGFTIDTEGSHSYMSFNKGNYWLQYGSLTKDDSIQLSIQNLDMKEFIFWGIIKNKSELKKLLKQLQIS